jgi:hypothetical protein
VWFLLLFSSNVNIVDLDSVSKVYFLDETCGVNVQVLSKMFLDRCIYGLLRVAFGWKYEKCYEIKLFARF